MIVSAESSLSDRTIRNVMVADSAQQAAAQPWVEIECFQIGTGHHLTQMKIADTGEHQLVSEWQGSAVHKLGCTPDDLCTISYCTSVPGFRFSDIGPQPPTPPSCLPDLYFLPERTEFDILVPAGAETVYCTVSQSDLLERLRVLDPARWSATPDHIRLLSSDGYTAFASGASRILDGPGSACIPSAQHSTDWIAQILSASQPCDQSRVGRLAVARAMRIAGQARDFADAQFKVDILPSVVDICAAIGVSERSLQYAFGRYVGMSPLNYLRLCRLNRARHALRAPVNPGVTVTDTALHYGFTHLGRFAGDYRRLFGESPSQTLSDAKRCFTDNSQFFAVSG